MGTTKVTIKRTAKKKDGSSQGTIKTTTKTKVSPDKVTTTKTRTVSKKSGGISVRIVKGS